MQQRSFYLGNTISTGVYFKYPANIFVEGEESALFYGFETDGIYQEGDDFPIAGNQPGDLKIIDQNGDGTIDLDEFLQHITAGTKRDVIQKALIQRNGIRQLFNKYDKDGNGKITRDEFRKIAEDKFQAKLTPKQIDDLMKQADYNNDGTLDYEEYVKAFSYMPVTD